MFKQNHRGAILWLSFLALLAFASVRTASADTVSITWTNPATNTDASAVPASGTGSLQSWRFEYGTCSSPNVFGTKVGEFTRTRAVGGAALTTTTNNFDPGQTCLRGYVSNTYGSESAVSNVVTKTVTAPTPGPIILAAIEPQAFSTLYDKRAKHWNVNLQIGTVTLGSECLDAPVLGDGYAVLAHPVKDVQLWPRKKLTKYVAAQCGMSGA